MRLEIPAHKTLVFEQKIALRWGDMDALGHVNNTLYFRYFEMIRVDWLQSIGLAPNPQGQGPVIVNTFCNFYRPLSYPGELLARQYVSDVGRSSFDTWITLARLDDPESLAAAGGATVVWFDAQAGASCPLPQRLREQLAC